MSEKNIIANAIDNLIAKFTENDFMVLFDYLYKNNIRISKRIKMLSLIDALRFDVMKTRQQCLMLDSRKNYRLLWFHLFTEFQLEELYAEFERPEILQAYIANVIKGIIINIYKFDKNHILKIKALKCNTKNVEITFSEFNEMFAKIESENEDSIEGVKINKIRAILYSSATTEEIIRLGHKYNIEIPEAFNGNQLREYLLAKFKVLNLLTESMYEEISNAPIARLREIAKENGVNTFKLNKKDSIEFVLMNILGDRYELPISDLEYEMAIPIDANNEKYSELLFRYEKVNGELIILRERLKIAEESNKKVIEDMILEKEALKEKYDQELQIFKKEVISIEFNQELLEEKAGKGRGKTFRLWLYTFIASTFALMICVCFYLILRQ